MIIQYNLNRKYIDQEITVGDLVMVVSLIIFGAVSLIFALIDAKDVVLYRKKPNEI